MTVALVTAGVHSVFRLTRVWIYLLAGMLEGARLAVLR
jgi:hypothetical protein